ncbi:hypothetical protein [Thalassobellus suaedae]|uniref:DUF4595 domain-containing protein n=1 Tax=Thalassobellus suaedae TaxID=3074124 RepID=A0ABY9XVB7_9FLAO|nr:hypothetical protein RHP51_04115 [Flavobacteriaceae bacterium HL-DH14]
MKKSIYLWLTVFSLILSFSCEDSVTEEFNEVNGNVAEKLIKSISVISADESVDNSTIIMSYENTKLSSISDGSDISYFIYNGNDLAKVTGQTEDFNMEELYGSPYDAFETGQVLEYDANNNPYKLLFFEEVYDYSTNTIDIKEYIAEVTYDNSPNPYFYSLEAAGLIDAMDKVQLNLSINSQPSEILKARALFPLNNPSKVVYKDENGDIIYIIDAEYVYDNENYPKSASVIATSIEDNTTSFYTTSFLYVN